MPTTDISDIDQITTTGITVIRAVSSANTANIDDTTTTDTTTGYMGIGRRRGVILAVSIITITFISGALATAGTLAVASLLSTFYNPL